MNDNLAPRAPAAVTQAVDWVVRHDASDMTLAEQREFDVWYADPANAHAYRRAKALWGEFDTVPPALRPQVESPARRVSRPAVWVGAALAASLLVVFLAPGLLTRWQADLTTSIGEIKTATLPDGSTVTLDTGSAVALDFAGGRRTVRLLTGEAAFAVAPDPARPFTVEAEGGVTRALGTEFIVRDDSGAVTVTGLVHKVEVTYPAGKGQAVTLGPDQTIHYGANTGMGIATTVSAKADSWRRGRLIVENRPLSAVVAELDRYHSGRVVILGDDVARLTVNGVFPLADTNASLAALRTSLGLKVTRVTNYLVIVSQ